MQDLKLLAELRVLVMRTFLRSMRSVKSLSNDCSSAFEVLAPSVKPSGILQDLARGWKKKEKYQAAAEMKSTIDARLEVI